MTADAELLTKTLTPADQFVILASDGVWEFLTNSDVASLVMGAGGEPHA